MEVLDELLKYDGCDINDVNHLQGAMLLHLAVKIEQPKLHALIMDSLLDASADTQLGVFSCGLPLF